MQADSGYVTVEKLTQLFNTEYTGKDQWRLELSHENGLTAVYQFTII